MTAKFINYEIRQVLEATEPNLRVYVYGGIDLNKSLRKEENGVKTRDNQCLNNCVERLLGVLGKFVLACMMCVNIKSRQYRLIHLCLLCGELLEDCWEVCWLSVHNYYICMNGWQSYSVHPKNLSFLIV